MVLTFYTLGFIIFTRFIMFARVIFAGLLRVPLQRDAGRFILLLPLRVALYAMEKRRTSVVLV